MNFHACCSLLGVSNMISFFLVCVRKALMNVFKCVMIMIMIMIIPLQKFLLILHTVSQTMYKVSASYNELKCCQESLGVPYFLALMNIRNLYYYFSCLLAIQVGQKKNVICKHDFYRNKT